MTPDKTGQAQSTPGISSVADQGVRDQALDIRHSFAVSAPAGSGKTGLLIRRTLRLLAECDHPEQVLAITFTRKAAAEMQERILKALLEGQDPTPPDDTYRRAIWEDARQVIARDTNKGWQLIANPGRLRIMTIDSLCRHLARQLAVESGLGDLPEPAEQPESYYREAVHNLFALLDAPGPVGDSLALLLEHLDNNPATLENLLVDLLGRREQWLHPLLSSRDARETLEQAMQDTVTSSLSKLRAALRPVASDVAGLCDYAAANLLHLHIASPLTLGLGMTDLPGSEASAENVAGWHAIAELLLTRSGGWRARPDKRSGFPTAKDAIDPQRADAAKQQLAEVIDWCRSQEALLELFNDLRHLPALAFSDSQWRLLEALAQLLPRLVAELSVVFQAHHACDFTEISLAAQRALGDEDDPSDLSLRLDYQIRHILVDEFQDTSSLQFDLLKKLVAGWQPGDGRTLFLVGDAMQSLYGFRNANVGLFLEARKGRVNQVELTPLDLTVNFRSDSTLVSWVNHTFTTVFPPREDISRGAVPYAMAQAARKGDPQARVTLDLFPQGSDETREAEAVIARIQEARLEDPNGSIAILARNRRQLAAILPALHEAGIAWQATDIDPLGTRMPVLDLLSLTRALLNPADRIAWLAVLRAPWCGLCLTDLYRIANPNLAEWAGNGHFPWLPGRILDPATPSELSSEGKQILERTAAVLRTAWHNRLRKPLRLWIEGTWLALGGPATLVDSVELAWCQQYFELLETHARGADLPDLDAFEQAVGKLYAAPATGFDNPVQVMTIHKSKGLEFDTVLIPGLGSGNGKNDSTLLYWRERLNERGESQLLIAPPLSPAEQRELESSNDGLASSQLVTHLKHEQKLKTALEDARVLYVACTRAIRRLHLFFNLPAQNPASGSLLACLWPSFADGFANCGALVTEHAEYGAAGQQDGDKQEDAGEERADGNESLTQLLRLPPDWRNPADKRLDSATTQLAAARAATLPVANGGDSLQRHTGTVLHRTLSRIVTDGVDTWTAERIARQQQVWRLQLAALGVSDAERALPLLEQAITQTLRDDVGRWLLDNSHLHSACELALCHAGPDGTVMRSVIDRTFVDKDVLWIVDYKSSRPLPGQSQAAFTALESERYRDQLSRYRQVMAAQHQGQIRTALYFPLLPLLVEVPTG